VTARSWIQTYTGRKFDPACPDPEQINIEDIAVSLSRIARFNGHSREFYCVAQHCVLVADSILAPNLQLAALLHDAAEAYIGGIARPLKQTIIDVDNIEEAILDAVAARFGFPPALFRHPLIRQADMAALATEKRDVIGPSPDDWDLPEPAWPDQIRPMPAVVARSEFMRRFYDLGGHLTIN